jgi:P27 family predicted phage terminase small subunit
MKRGTLPKPAALRELGGNAGKRKIVRPPTHGAPGRMPAPPESLQEDAAIVWRDLGKRLLSVGLFEHVDRYALMMFCAAAGRWIAAERKIQESGGEVLTSEAGNLYQNPWLHTANRAWDQMRQMLGQFGLTPAERMRVARPEAEGPTSLADELWSLVQTGEKRK